MVNISGIFLLWTNLEKLSPNASPEEIFHKLGVLSLFMNFLGPCCQHLRQIFRTSVNKNKRLSVLTTDKAMMTPCQLDIYPSVSSFSSYRWSDPLDMPVDVSIFWLQLIQPGKKKGEKQDRNLHLNSN